MSNTPDYITPEGEELHYWEMEDRTEEMLDECYDLVVIGGMTYQAGRVLREIDPIAFDECVQGEIHSLTEDEELDEWREDHPWRGLPEPASNAPEGALDVWLRFDEEDDEESEAEANIYPEGGYFVVKWELTAVGQVTSVPFLTYQGAREWLESAGFRDFSA